MFFAILSIVALLNIAIKKVFQQALYLNVFHFAKGVYIIKAQHHFVINARKESYCIFKKNKNKVFPSRQRRVYHQCEALHITNGLPLYIIIAKEIQPSVDEILALSRYARQGG